MSDKTLKVIAIVALVAVILSAFNSYLIFDSTTNIQEQLDTQKDWISALNNNQTKQIEELKTNMDEQIERFSALQNKLETVEANYADQQKQISGLQIELDQINVELEDNILALSTLVNQVNILEDNIDQLTRRTPSDVYASAYKSVVLITTPTGQGSGFMFENKTRIVTNYHVITNETNIEIQYFDGTRTNATTLGADPYSDLAVLEVSMSPDEVEPLTLSNESIGVGQQVVAIGNPLGSTDSLTVGYISQVNKLLDIYPIITPVFQLDLTITFGSSGGPLLDLSGNVIGVTNAGTFFGLNYAIPLDILRRVVPSLISEGEYKHPFVGVSIIALTPQLITGANISNIDPYQNGLLILDVFPDYPAEEAGLTPVIYEQEEVIAVDIILAIDDHQVLTIEDWSAYMETKISAGETVTLTVWRSGEINSVQVTTTERPPP